MLASAGETLNTVPAPNRSYTIREGFRRALPVALVVGVFGVSFGVLARASGFPLLAPMIMSLTTFGASAQFAAASVLGDGGGVAAAAIAAVLLNARYAPIGLSVSPALRGGVLQRFVHANLVVDESWGVANVGGRVNRELLIGAGLAVYVCWFVGTVVGSIGGNFIGDPNAFGLDAAFPALFVALIAPQLRRREAVQAALIGGAVALLLVPLARPGIPILAASMGCLVGWRRR